MKKYLLSTPFFAVLGRSAGLFIPFFVAFIYGAGHETDAFFLAFSLMTFLTNILTYLFEAILVPYLAEEKIRSESAIDFANGVLFIVLPLLTLLSLFIWCFIRFVLPPPPSNDDSLMSGLFLEMIPFLLFGIGSAQTNGIFYTYKVFLFPALSPFFRSLVVLVFIFVFKPFLGIHALSLGYVGGEILRWGTGIFLLRRRTRWRLAVDWSKVESRIRIFFKSAGFQVLGLMAVNIIYFVDLSFASRLGTGSASVFNYADRMLQVPFLLFQAGFLQIFLSFWSHDYQQKSRTSFWAVIRRDTGIVFLISLLLSVVLWMFREPLMGAIFGHGNFSRDQLSQLSSLFGWLALALAPAIIYTLYIRVLFVLKQSATYCLVGWIQLGAKIILNFLFMKRAGIQGIALSTLSVMSALAFGLYLYFRQYWKPKGAYVIP